MNEEESTSKHRPRLFLVAVAIGSIGSILTGLGVLFLHPLFEPDLSFFETFLAVLIGITLIWVGFYLLTVLMENLGIPILSHPETENA